MGSRTSRSNSSPRNAVVMMPSKNSRSWMMGVGDAAAERAAGANRTMRDVANDGSEQAAERTILDRFLECGMAHPGADAEPAVLDHQAVEFGHGVDVDEMLRPGQTERHGRDE